MTTPLGPIWASGTQAITKDGYTIVFLADINNNQLQQEGQPAVYYWLPNSVRLARKNGDNGDYKFSFMHFVGDDAGSDGQKTGGGLLAFSTISAPPGNVLQEAQDDLLNRFRGSSDYFWGWRNNIAPMIRPAPIVANTTTVTNLSPNADGSVPVPSAPTRSGPRAITTTRSVPLYVPPRTYALRDAARASNLDVWYANLQGQGSGSVLPTAENAYSGLVGSYPAALIWQSFHGSSSAITVWQDMKLRVWSPVVYLLIEGSWQRIQDHFSAAAHAGGLFWSADVQVEFNSMVTDGTIKVTTRVDQTIPNADKIADELNKTKDLIFQKFMDAAQKTIFDPAAFNEAPAQASGGFLGFGGGGAVKLRRDQVNLNLRYEEEQQFAYIQDYPISGQMDGMYDQIKNDPQAEKRYFQTVYLGDWQQDVSRVVKPVVNYPDPQSQWVGQPVAFLSVQLGYPDVNGAIQWDGNMFQATDRPDTVWNWKKSKKNAADVNPTPANWTPDLTYVKREVHLAEVSSDIANPFVRMQVETNVIDLDPGANGRLLNDVNLEVRVESTGTLSVGPISLGRNLTDATQNVEVTLQALGKDSDGQDHAPVKFLWKFEDQDKDRFWMLYTGQLDFVPRFQYKVRVVVKGNLFTDGMEWEGPWEQASSSGPLIVTVPKRDADGVVTRALPSVTGATVNSGTPAPSTSATPSTTPIGHPPTTATPVPAGSPYGGGARNGKKSSDVLTVRGYSLVTGKGIPQSAVSDDGNPKSNGDLSYDIIVPSFD